MTKKSKITHAQKKRELKNKQQKAKKINQKKQQKENFLRSQSQSKKVNSSSIEVISEQKVLSQKELLEIELTEKSNQLKSLFLEVLLVIQNNFPDILKHYSKHTFCHNLKISICQHHFFNSISPVFEDGYGMSHNLYSITPLNYDVYLNVKKINPYSVYQFYLKNKKNENLNILVNNIDIIPSIDFYISTLINKKDIAKEDNYFFLLSFKMDRFKKIIRNSKENKVRLSTLNGNSLAFINKQKLSKQLLYPLINEVCLISRQGNLSNFDEIFRVMTQTLFLCKMNLHPKDYNLLIWDYLYISKDIDSKHFKIVVEYLISDIQENLSSSKFLCDYIFQNLEHYDILPKLYILLDHKLISMKTNIIDTQHLINLFNFISQKIYHPSMLEKLDSYGFFNLLNDEQFLSILERGDFIIKKYLYFQHIFPNYIKKDNSRKNLLSKIIYPKWECSLLCSPEVIHQLSTEEYKIILSTKPNLEQKVEKSADKGVTPLIALCCCDMKFYSETREKIVLLLNQGCDVNCVDSIGLSPLKCAVINQNIDLVKLLLEYGADSNVCGEFEKPYLIYLKSYTINLIKDDNDRMKRIFIPNKEIHYRNYDADYGTEKISYRDSPLMLAFKVQNIRSYGRLDNPLNWEIIKLLIDKNANVNYMNEIGETILFVALSASFPNTQADHCDDFSTEDYENLLYLLDKGIIVNYVLPERKIKYSNEFNEKNMYDILRRRLYVEKLHPMIFYIKNMRNTKGKWLLLLIKLLKMCINKEIYQEELETKKEMETKKDTVVKANMKDLLEVQDSKGNNLVMIYCSKYHMFFDTKILYLLIHYGFNPFHRNNINDTIVTDSVMSKNTRDFFEKKDFSLDKEDIQNNILLMIRGNPDWLNELEIEMKYRYEKSLKDDEEFRSRMSQYSDSDDYDYYSDDYY